MKRAHKALLRGLLGGALLVAVIALADPARVLAQLRQAHVGWLLAGLAAAVASNVVSALRWRALARWLGADVSVRDASRWYFQAIGLNALLPGAVLGGDLYRAVVLRRAGQATLASSWSVVLDRVSGLWMLCAIGGLGAARGGGRGVARTFWRGGAGGRGRGRDLRAVPAGAGGDGRAGVRVAGARREGRRYGIKSGVRLPVLDFKRKWPEIAV